MLKKITDFFLLIWVGSVLSLIFIFIITQINNLYLISHKDNNAIIFITIISLFSLMLFILLRVLILVKEIKKNKKNNLKSNNFSRYLLFLIPFYILIFASIVDQETPNINNLGELRQVSIPEEEEVSHVAEESEEITFVEDNLSQDDYYNTSSSTDTQEWGSTIKIDEFTSRSKFAPDPFMATSEELNIAMKSYRQSRNLPTLAIDPILCEIANKRVEHQIENGGLDDHVGFEPLAKEQNTFRDMAEVLFGGTQNVSATHIIEWGWDQSLTGHRETISDSYWNEGCGAVQGKFAVYIFGKK